MRVLLLALALSVGIPVSVASADRPVITHAPEVSGRPEVGKTLKAVNARWNGTDVEAIWRWYRCKTGFMDSCRRIHGARRSRYEVGSDDVGRRLRVRLRVQSSEGFAYVYSLPSAVARPDRSRPPTPPPTEPPDPPVEPVPDTPPSTQARMIRPFPIVHIRGVLTARGVRLTLLTVTAPRRASIALVCHGRSCPVGTWGRVSRVTRLRTFERPLRAGTRLEISVTQPGWIGKYTKVTIRGGKVPLRRDGCVYPDSRRPEACPAG